MHDTVRQVAKAHLSSDGAPARLGAELVDRIVHHSSDGGLGWVYATLNQDPDHIPPTERPAMTFFGLADSPVFTFIVKKCLEEKEKGKRALVVMNSPWMPL